jgi:hypothetical protein
LFPTQLEWGRFLLNKNQNRLISDVTTMPNEADVRNRFNNLV